MKMDLRKTELRKQIGEEIDALPPEYIASSDSGLFQLTTALNEYITAGNIMIYCSVEKEPATVKIALDALSSGKTVAFPYCFRGGVMQARIARSLGELRPAMLGIPAPPDSAPFIVPGELDLIIVPALAYDRSGYRLGYGGGYYDRYLSGVPAFTVGLARERLMRDELPREPHDIAVKCVITESAVLHTGAQ